VKEKETPSQKVDVAMKTEIKVQKCDLKLIIRHLFVA
jgi:hypothetical protein